MTKNTQREENRRIKNTDIKELIKIAVRDVDSKARKVEVATGALAKAEDHLKALKLESTVPF